MNTNTTEKSDTAQITGTHKAKAGKKASIARKRAHVATKKSKATPKVQFGGKASKGANNATVRNGSKVSIVLDLLKRADGATLAELMKATGWQAHSLRGFLSGVIRKKLRLTVTSAKTEEGKRTYFVKA